MTIPSTVTPKAWINTLVLAGWVCSAVPPRCKLKAAMLRPLIDTRCEPSLDDSYVGDEYFDDNGYLKSLRSAANFDHVWEGDHVAAYGSATAATHATAAARASASAAAALVDPSHRHLRRVPAVASWQRGPDLTRSNRTSVVPGEDPTGPVGRVNVDTQRSLPSRFLAVPQRLHAAWSPRTLALKATRPTRITAAPGNFLNSQTDSPQHHHHRLHALCSRCDLRHRLPVGRPGVPSHLESL